MQRFIYSFSKAFHKQILLSLMLALITYVPLAAHTRVLKLFHAFSHILKLFAYFHAFPASYKIVVYCIQGFFFYTVCVLLQPLFWPKNQPAVLQKFFSYKSGVRTNAAVLLYYLTVNVLLGVRSRLIACNLIFRETKK